MNTQFASATRSSKSDIVRDNEKIISLDYIVEISESTNTLFMILNTNRQIIFANQELLSLLNVSIDETLGQRPGEILNCVNAKKLKSS